MVCPPPQFQKESEQEACFLPSLFSSIPSFAGATLGCCNVTNPQLPVDPWPCRPEPMRHNGVPLDRVKSWASLSVGHCRSFDLHLPLKLDLLDEKCSFSFWLLFQWPTTVKQEKYGVARIFYWCLASRLATKWQRPYSVVMKWVKLRMQFAVFRAVDLRLRGTRRRILGLGLQDGAAIFAHQHWHWLLSLSLSRSYFSPFSFSLFLSLLPLFSFSLSLSLSLSSCIPCFSLKPCSSLFHTL